MTIRVDDSALLARKLGRQINDYIVAELKEHGIVGIVTSHGSILYQLFKSKSLKMGELAKLIDKDRSTVTTLVGKLSSMDYVNITKDQTDRRSTRVSLTQKGKAIEPIMDKISQKLIGKMYKDISPQQRSDYYETMQRIISNFDS